MLLISISEAFSTTVQVPIFFAEATATDFNYHTDFCFFESQEDNSVFKTVHREILRFKFLCLKYQSSLAAV